jgi:alpha-mannosidase
VKRSNDGHGLVVRIYNPLDYTVEAILCPCFAFKAAYIANLLEERQEAIHSLGQQSVHVHLRGGGIITLIFE